MRLHHRSRTIAIHLMLIFASTFVGAFLLLNARFVEKSIQYSLAPGTIKTRNTLEDAIRLLPLSQKVSEKPLPDSARLVIDSIGVSAPIVFGTPDDNDLIYDELENGVVHYSSSPKPGLPGAALILGHSSAYPWYRGDYGAVFALLSKLKTGERFYVQYEDNRTFVYEVSGAVIFNPFVKDDQSEALERMEQEGGSSIILISCYPVGTSYRRIAVQAKVVAI
jgi:LPXTG-site transpeptidase (sortase) family protein